MHRKHLERLNQLPAERLKSKLIYILEYQPGSLLIPFQFLKLLTDLPPDAPITIEEIEQKLEHVFRRYPNRDWSTEDLQIWIELSHMSLDFQTALRNLQGRQFIRLTDKGTWQRTPHKPL